MRELLFGRVAPALCPPDAVVKSRGLAAINDYRQTYGMPRLATLPQGTPGVGYEDCLLGNAFQDMPEPGAHAKAISIASPEAEALEVRFERGQLPELIDPVPELGPSGLEYEHEGRLGVAA